MPQENQIPKHKRRFPLNEKFMNYRFPDLEYAYLQYIATYNPYNNKLYVNYNRVAESKPDMEEKCQVSRRTIDRHIKEMEEKGIIKGFINDQYYAYEIVIDKDEKYQLVEKDMLMRLINTSNKNCIKIYVYLLNKYLWKKETNSKYIFTNEELYHQIGYKGKQGKTNEIIRDILDSMYRQGIIKWQNVIENIDVDGKIIPRIRKELLFVAQSVDELPPLDIKTIKR